jgi:hypothetical protein
MPQNPLNPESPENRDKGMSEGSVNAEGSRPEDAERKKPRFTWKRVLMLAIALVVVGSLVQVIAKSGGFGGALNTTGGKSGTENRKGAPKEIKSPAQKPKTVHLGGQKIPRESGPVIVVNPGLVTPGGKAMVQGAGFDAGSGVDLLLKTSAKQSQGKSVGTAKTDKSGSINAQITVPEDVGRDVTLVAQQRGGDKVAEAQLVSGGVVGSVKVSKAVGKPGAPVSLNVQGFGAGAGCHADC